jgi:flagellar biosynthesis protein FlhF
VLERTYKAKHMGEALAHIKRDLGADAVILSSREVRERSSKGFALSVEVTAAPFGGLDRGAADRLSMSAADARAGSLERRFLDSGVPMNAARTLSMRVRRELREGKATLVDSLTEALRSEVAFATKGRSRVCALVGPTGVGKTTTVAKLAAVAALVEQRTVALVCLDQYRVGASEQLQRYADLIGIPMESATDAKSLDRALRRLSRADLVLVDTSGRSPRDISGIAQTADTLRGASEQVEVHLCVPASMREAELVGTIERQSVASPSRLVVTKLDEANFCGGVLAAYVHSGLPLAYFTTGQRVPEDIEMASAEGLSKVLCGEEVQ